MLKTNSKAFSIRRKRRKEEDNFVHYFYKNRLITNMSNGFFIFRKKVQGIFTTVHGTTIKN